MELKTFTFCFTQNTYLTFSQDTVKTRQRFYNCLLRPKTRLNVKRMITSKNFHTAEESGPRTCLADRVNECHFVDELFASHDKLGASFDQLFSFLDV